LLGADASVANLTLNDSKTPQGQFPGGATAQGFVIAGCSTFTGHDIENTVGVGTGLFVDQSSVSITGGTKTKPSLNISQQQVGGVVITDLDPTLGQQVTLEGFEIANVHLVGLSATFASLGVNLSHGSITGTLSSPVALAAGEIANVGDGLVWADGSQLILDDIDISSNARVNFVLDGDAGPGSSVSNVTLNHPGSSGDAVVQATGTLPPGLSDLSPDIHANDRVLQLWNASKAPSTP
jgi:hypothetical protein